MCCGFSQSALVYGLCVFKARVNNARVFVWPVVLFLRDRQCRMRFVNSTRAGVHDACEQRASAHGKGVRQTHITAVRKHCQKTQRASHQSSLPNAAKGYPPREPRERVPFHCGTARTWSTWSAVINLTPRTGELRSAPSCTTSLLSFTIYTN